MFNTYICIPVYKLSYQVQTKRDLHDKVIKMLNDVTDEMFSKDFLFYFLLAYRFIL